MLWGRRSSDILARPVDCLGNVTLARSIVERGANAANRVATGAAPCVRNTFRLALDRLLPEAARRGESFSLLLVSVENVRGTSDPEKLRLAAAKLEAAGQVFIASVRSTDWVARFDATTFAFLLPGAAHAGGLIVAERLRRKLSIATLPAGSSPLRLTVSIGATNFVPGDDSASILHRAEEALHAAIESGGNCIRSRLGDRVEAPATESLAAIC